MTISEAGIARPRTGAGFAPYHKWDRNAFLVLVALIWLGAVMGFGPTILKHSSANGSHPVVLHLHAVAFTGWLLLLTTQVLLIRARRPDLHRRLGIASMALAPVMVVLGVATSIAVEQIHFGTPLSRPTFLAVTLTDMLAFAGLVGAGFVLRGNSQAHKRLILLATFYIVDAGYSRWLGGSIRGVLGSGFTGRFTGLFLGPDLLLLALGGYDFATRGRLHPAYIAGALWMLACQLGGIGLLLLPQWRPVALAIIGH